MHTLNLGVDLDMESSFLPQELSSYSHILTRLHTGETYDCHLMLNALLNDLELPFSDELLLEILSIV